MPPWEEPSDGRRERPERRAFAEERGNRSAARYDQDRMRDAGAAGYSRPHTREEDLARYGRPRTGGGWGGEPNGYAGQEYGVESRREAPGEPLRRRSGFDYDDPGVGQSQAGYAPPGGSPPRARSSDDAFDPDYLSWREQQLREHDRRYQDWRREQHRRYDEEYRRYRGEGRRGGGQGFEAWRAGRQRDRD